MIAQKRGVFRTTLGVVVGRCVQSETNTLFPSLFLMLVPSLSWQTIAFHRARTFHRTKLPSKNERFSSSSSSPSDLIYL
jgi:hypothetical protein